MELSIQVEIQVSEKKDRWERAPVEEGEEEEEDEKEETYM